MNKRSPIAELHWNDIPAYIESLKSKRTEHKGTQEDLLKTTFTDIIQAHESRNYFQNNLHSQFNLKDTIDITRKLQSVTKDNAITKAYSEFFIMTKDELNIDDLIEQTKDISAQLKDIKTEDHDKKTITSAFSTMTSILEDYDSDIRSMDIGIKDEIIPPEVDIYLNYLVCFNIGSFTSRPVFAMKNITKLVEKIASSVRTELRTKIISHDIISVLFEPIVATITRSDYNIFNKVADLYCVLYVIIPLALDALSTISDVSYPFKDLREYREQCPFPEDPTLFTYNHLNRQHKRFGSLISEAESLFAYKTYLPLPEITQVTKIKTQIHESIRNLLTNELNHRCVEFKIKESPKIAWTRLILYKNDALKKLPPPLHRWVSNQVAEVASSFDYLKNGTGEYWDRILD